MVLFCAVLCFVCVFVLCAGVVCIPHKSTTNTRNKHTTNTHNKYTGKNTHTRKIMSSKAWVVFHTKDMVFWVYPVFFYVLNSLVVDVFYIDCAFVCDFGCFVCCCFVCVLCVCFRFRGVFAVPSNVKSVLLCFCCLFLWFVFLGVLLLLFCV